MLNMNFYKSILVSYFNGLKLFMKETVFPASSNTMIFMFSPILTFFLALLSWCIIPINEGFVFVDLSIGILYLFAMSSLGVYGIIVSGWSSNSKYAFLGCLSSAAQMISYEISIGLILIAVLLCSGSLNLTTLMLAQYQIWYCVPLFPFFFMFFISCLAENNSAPFDLPEAEAELVAGYNVEYSAMGFALFFLGEYANMILMCSLTVICFLGGWLPIINITIFHWIPNIFWFGLKVTLLLYMYMWVRAAFPSFRYNQLMSLGWKIFLPLVLGLLLFLIGWMYTFNLLPL